MFAISSGVILLFKAFQHNGRDDIEHLYNAMILYFYGIKQQTDGEWFQRDN